MLEATSDNAAGIGTTPPIDNNLLTSHALAVLTKKLRDFDARLEKIKAEAREYVYYPDGTLLISGVNIFNKLWSLIIKEQLVASDGIWEPCVFASLEPFPATHYALWYTSNYRESLGELAFKIIFPGICTRPTRDYQLDNLQISILFKRKPNAQTRHRFAMFLETWFQSVSRRGLFREGSVRRVSKEIEFRGRLGQFRIDVSHSGQNTLNWLLLSVLNFGYEVSAIEQFIFNHENQIEHFAGPLESKIEKSLLTSTSR